MKIQANTRPRSDGTVIYRNGEQKIVFATDESGFPVAEVDDDAVIAQLLSSRNFEPANERDFERAEALLAAPAEADDEDDDDEPADAAPLEANTPPKRRPGRPRKAA